MPYNTTLTPFFFVHDHQTPLDFHSLTLSLCIIVMHRPAFFYLLPNLCLNIDIMQGCA